MAFAKKARGETSGEDASDAKDAGAPRPGDGPKSATANAAPGAPSGTATPAAPITASEGPHDGFPKPGDGAKSATRNAEPTDAASSGAPTPSATAGGSASGGASGAPTPSDTSGAPTPSDTPDKPNKPGAGAAVSDGAAGASGGSAGASGGAAGASGGGAAGAGAGASGASGRARSETVAMGPGVEMGAPPGMPMALGVVEEPTRMPAGSEVEVGGDPEALAPAPGEVPRGDSRSLRRPGEREEFVLIYRRGTQIITRAGVVGKRGQWRVVDYPTTASAANAYARECSRFVSEGFSDYRS